MTKPGTSMTMLIYLLLLLLLLLVPIAIIIIFIIIIVYFRIYKRQRHNNINSDSEESEQTERDTSAVDDFLDKHDQHKIPAGCFKEHKVKKGCELKKFMGRKFKSGKVYYQLTERENIYEDKSLIFKVKNKF